MNAPLRTLSAACLLGSLVTLPASADGRLLGETARVRVIHASPDTPAVDVLANDVLALFSSARFGDVTDYVEVPANVYDVKVVPAGGGPDTAAIQTDLNLFYGTDYTVVAVDMREEIRAIVLEDDNSQPTANRARVRFLHAVPDAPAVDLKVTDGPFLFQDIAFESLGDSVSVPAGVHALEVRVAGTDTIVLEVADVTLQDGGVYTLLATGLLEDGSLGVQVAEDNRRETIVTPMPELPSRPLAGVEIQFQAPGGDQRLR